MYIKTKTRFNYFTAYEWIICRFGVPQLQLQLQLQFLNKFSVYNFELTLGNMCMYVFYKMSILTWLSVRSWNSLSAFYRINMIGAQTRFGQCESAGGLESKRQRIRLFRSICHVVFFVSSETRNILFVFFFVYLRWIQRFWGWNFRMPSSPYDRGEKTYCFDRGCRGGWTMRATID